MSNERTDSERDADQPRPQSTPESEAEGIKPNIVMPENASAEQRMEANIARLDALLRQMDDQPPGHAEEIGAVDSAQPETGFGLLHLAILDNDIEKVRAAVTLGAPFFADANGRWPSTLAVLLERSDEICDYVGDEEAKFLGLPV